MNIELLITVLKVIAVLSLVASLGFWVIKLDRPENHWSDVIWLMTSTLSVVLCVMMTVSFVDKICQAHEGFWLFKLSFTHYLGLLVLPAMTFSAFALLIQALKCFPFDTDLSDYEAPSADQAAEDG